MADMQLRTFNLCLIALIIGGCHSFSWNVPGETWILYLESADRNFRFYHHTEPDVIKITPEDGEVLYKPKNSEAKIGTYEVSGFLLDYDNYTLSMNFQDEIIEYRIISVESSKLTLRRNDTLYSFKPIDGDWYTPEQIQKLNQ
ncbi:hypothetical protein [Gracilimonas sediminicola]|uniref:Lipoprotein n=1 Tax=Gracilimonas sediminicola TaxID=2952158 RepID=A0A9X2L0Q9_9BACT|nr:hypothetical protein [Gracilimonas sediminicola]MCP9290049.1 hypothetical protein [Gracilimonas sediminicola]